MTEYSRAPRRGHRELAGERSMRIGRHPSPWPCVAMLAALLLMCLMAPQYWETNVVCQDPTINGPSDGRRNALELSPGWGGIGRSGDANFDELTFNVAVTATDQSANTATDDSLASVAVAPTIEELVNHHGFVAVPASDRGQFNRESYEWPLLLQPTSSPAPSKTEAQAYENVEFSSQEAALFNDVGEFLANWLPIEYVPQQLSRLSDGFVELLAVAPVAETQPSFPALHRSTVRIVSPDDRLAMLPEPRALESSHRWCVPQTLFALVERLAEQADSAQWASHVRNQLHALTGRERLEGDDIQSILARFKGPGPK